METVIDVLKATGKATAREIAARMKIEPVEVLAMLREHEGLERVTSINGYWTLLVPFAPEEKPEVAPVAAVIPPPPFRAKNIKKAGTPRRPERLDPDVEFGKISVLLREQGDMTANELGKALNRDPRGLISTLRVLEKLGRIVKNRKNKGTTWSLPVEEVTTEMSQTETFVQSIPSLIKPQSELTLPTLAQIAKEIRQTRTKLTRLEKLRGTVRDLGKHKKIIQQIQGGVA